VGRKIFLSVADLFPWILGQEGPSKAIRFVKKIGADGLQILPLRGWNRITMGVIPKEMVVAYEEAWNQGSLWDVVRRFLRPTGDKWPKPEDWAFFGPRPADIREIAGVFRRGEDGRPFYVVHEPPKTKVNNETYEINPEGGMPGPNCYSLALDTLHLRRFCRNGQPSPLEPWPILLKGMDPKTAVLIHVHPTIAEAGPLVRGADSELAFMMRELAGFCMGPVVIEVAPRLGPPAATTSFLQRLLDRTHKLMS